ncbi:MAG: transposase [Paracoccaceae bacterium]|jgi:transposase
MANATPSFNETSLEVLSLTSFGSVVRSSFSLTYPLPYSPDFNPIENAFAKLKALLRKSAERTVEGLWVAIGCITDTFPPAERANCFSACDYDPDW